MMNKQTMKRAAFFAIAGAIALGAATPSWAAPVPSSTRALENAAPSVVTDVRYRGHRARNYRGSGAGVALGVLGLAAGVAVGAAAYGQQDYYGSPGYYGPGYPGYRQDYVNPGYRRDYEGGSPY